MRVIYNKLTLEVISVVEDENSISHFPIDNAVIQGSDDLIVKVAYAVGLDVSQITGLIMDENYKLVLKDRSFCEKIKNKMLASQKTAPINDNATYKMLVEAFRYAKEAAENGNPSQVKYELELITDDLPLNDWAVVKQSLIDEINEYLTP